SAVSGIVDPGSESLKTIKFVVPGRLLSGLGGRAMLLHVAVAAAGEDVVVKAVSVVEMSDVLIRDASRSPSRPNALPVVVPVLSVNIKSVKDIVLLGNVVTLATDTARPVAGGVGVGDAGILPKATEPVTRIRTGGLGYNGVEDVVSVRSQLLRNGFHKFGT